MQEEWKDINGFEGKYQISNFGRVRALNYNKIKGNIKIMKNTDNGHGYLKIHLRKPGVSIEFYIHRLVIEHFLGEIPDNMEIDHIDTIKTNNKLNNLQIVTRKLNSYNPITTVHRKQIHREVQGRPVKCDDKLFNSLSEIAEYFDVTKSAIYNYIHNKLKTIKGKSPLIYYYDK